MDTAGQELFRTLTSSYYRNADLILIVYDKSNIATTEDLQEFFVDVGRYAKRAKIILIGNKSDIENPAITTEQGQVGHYVSSCILSLQFLIIIFV